MASTELVIEIKAEIEGIKKDLTNLKAQIKSIERPQRVSRFTRWKNELKTIRDQLLSLKTLIASVFSATAVGLFTKSVLDAASSAEQLKLRLQMVTGEGEKTFRTLVKWASTLPISTQKAVDVFISLQAMGLKPTLDQMRLLVDTTLALGGSSDTLEGIGRALGQIAAKGKLSMEEVLQLAERGVPIFEILKQELNLTGEALANLGAQGISAQTAISAIFRGLEKRFGGASQEFANTWQGLIEQLNDIWYRFKLTVAESGPFQVMKKAISDLVSFLNSQTGQIKLKEWATATGEALLSMIQTAITGFRNLLSVILSVKKALGGIRWFGEYLGVKAAEFSTKAGLLMSTMKKVAVDPFNAKKHLQDLTAEWERLGKIAEEQITENTKKFLEETDRVERRINSLQQDTTKMLEELRQLAEESKEKGSEYLSQQGQPKLPIPGPEPVPFEGGGEDFLPVDEEWVEYKRSLYEKLELVEEKYTEIIQTEVERRITELEREKEEGIDALFEAYWAGLLDFEELQRKMTDIEEAYSKKRQEILEEERRKREELSLQAKLTDIKLAERRGEISPVEALRQQVEIYKTLASTAQQRLSTLSEESSTYYEQLHIFQQYQMQINELQMRLQELTGSFDEGFVSAIKKAGQEMASAFKMGQRLAKSLISTIENTLANVIEDAVTGKLRKAEDYARSFGRAMLSVLSQIIAKLIVVKTLQFAGVPVIGFEKGGVVEGLKVIQAFQTGGIVERPTLAMIGEGKHKEAIVPLPDGRHIPAIVTEQSEEPQITIVNVVDPSMMEDFLLSQKGRKIIENIIRGAE